MSNRSKQKMSRRSSNCRSHRASNGHVTAAAAADLLPLAVR
jgi:hypothetical protein